MNQYIIGNFTTQIEGILSYVCSQPHLASYEELVAAYISPHSFEDRTKFQQLLFPVIWSFLLEKEKVGHTGEGLTPKDIEDSLKSRITSLLRVDYISLLSYMHSAGIENIPVQDFIAFCIWIENNLEA